MPAFSFSGEPVRGAFWKLILSGEKTMTTRKARKVGSRVGQTVHLYWKTRVPVDKKPIHLIGRSPIINVVRYDNMRRLLLGLGVNGVLEYIKAEGFNDLGELVEWWTGEPSPSYGVAEGGIMLSEESWEALETTGPIEVIQWAYPLTVKGES